MAIYDSATINGRTYHRGDSFTIAANGTWYGSSDGTSGSGSYSAGTTATFYAYSTESYSRYPYSIKSNSFNGNYPVWTSISAFPQGSYTVTYNANGGTGAPSNQTKTHGVALILSSTVPSKANTSTTWTLNLNANGGTTDTPTMTTSATLYWGFTGWLSSSDSNLYNPGASYTKDANTTMTAQWYSSGIATAVTLPTASHFIMNGYRLAGFALSPSSTTPDYLPGASFTVPYDDYILYAIYTLADAKVNVKVNNQFTQGLAYVKKDGAWIPVVHIYTKQNGQWVE